MLDRSFVFMGHARDHITIAGEPGDSRLQLVFPGDEVSVRSAVQSAMGALRIMALGEHVEGVAEIVLAEVLNNIVEHAYAGFERGVIEIVVDRLDDALSFRVTDDGRPMPEDEIPVGQPQDLDVSHKDLPEGGFGWFLIRELSQGLDYARSANRNVLTFRIPLGVGSRPN